MGAACSLSQLKETLEAAVETLKPERIRGFKALVATLRCLAGKQIRNMAVSLLIGCVCVCVC